MPVGGVGQSPDYGSMHANGRDAVPDKLTKVQGELEKFLTKIGVETTRPLDEASIAGKVDKAYNKYYVTVDKEGNIAFKEKTWYSKFRSAIGQKDATGLKEVFKTIQRMGVKELSGSDLETYKLLANVTNSIVEQSLDKGKPSKLTAELETLKLQTQAGVSGAFNASLYSAFRAGNDDAVNQLIKSGADINGTDKDGKTMLHLAAEKGDLKLIGKLRDAGADMACKDNLGNSPLHFAAKGGSGEVLQELIELGVQVSDINSEGRNALHLAAQHGNTEAVRALIGSSNIEKADNSGMTPLHIAVENGNLEAVKELLAGGAKADSVTADGETLIVLAKRKGFDEMAMELLKTKVKQF